MRSRLVAVGVIATLVGATFGISNIARAEPLITPHDNFEDAKTMGAIPYEDRMPIAYQATSQEGEPLCRSSSARTVWYRFTPDEDQVIELDRGGATTIVAIAVYLGENLDSLTQIACGSSDAPLPFVAKAGVTHHIQVGVNHTSEVIFQAFEGTSVNGRITDQTGAPVPGACVWALRYRGSYYSFQTSTKADGNGRYYLAGLPTGEYALQFGCSGTVWKSEYYKDKSLLSQADFVSYSRGTNLVVDAELTRLSSISGTLTDQGGNPVGTCAYARSPEGSYLASDNSSAEDGSYTVVVPPGNYVVQFGCSNDAWFFEFYNDVHDISSAQIVAVPDITDLSGFDATLARRGRISGRILRADGVTIPSSQCAKLYPAGNPNSFANISANDDDDGSYELFAEAGTYKLFFGGCWGDTAFVPEWYENKAGFDSATTITIANGDEFVIDALLEKIPPPPNDNRANAEVIDSFPFTKTPTLISATREAGEPDTCSSFGGTAWYRFTPSEETDLTLTLGDRNADVGVFVETTLGALQQVACGSYFTDSNTGFVAEAGRTYLIQVSLGATAVATFKGERLLGATSTEIYAPLPCAFACPYWAGGTTTEQNIETSCAPEPETVPDSFHDTQVTVPTEIDGRIPTHLVFHVRPEIDYDLLICRTVPDEDGNYYVTHGANIVGQGCPDVGVACREDAFAEIVPGETYILRAYNWSDQSTAPGLYGYASLP